VLERKLVKKLLGETWGWSEMDFETARMTADRWRVMLKALWTKEAWKVLLMMGEV